VKLLVTGAGGQLATELVRTRPEGADLVLRSEAELDISDRAAVEQELVRVEPDAVINAAAFTAVDAAESARERAFAVNASGAEYLALGARRAGAYLLQVSTDFVFDGAQGRPYLPDDETHPLGVYGASKRQGELLVQAAWHKSAILRTSWLYASAGHNFVHTMLRLLRRDGRVRVVGDQVGTPTWARSLAQAAWRFVERREHFGVHHFTDAGTCSWYDFAVAIAEEALTLGLLAAPAQVEPIRTEDYPTPAVRPPYSVLDKTKTWQAIGWEPIHWRVQLRRMLSELSPPEGR
jgi:dTDP-4-dehydrorhamnose reductase